MGRRRSLRDELVGTMVVVNDKTGNGYVGLLVSADESMVRLERSAVDGQVKFVDGKSKHELLFDWVNVPAVEVLFIAGAG